MYRRLHGKKMIPPRFCSFITQEGFIVQNQMCLQFWREIGVCQNETLYSYQQLLIHHKQRVTESTLPGLSKYEIALILCKTFKKFREAQSVFGRAPPLLFSLYFSSSSYGMAFFYPTQFLRTRARLLKLKQILFLFKIFIFEQNNKKSQSLTIIFLRH